MFRATMNSNSANAFVYLREGGATGFQTRAVAGGGTSVTPGNWVTHPYWLRLARMGNEFEAFVSPDGAQWWSVGSTNINMPETISIGLAVTSRRRGVLSTGTFDNLRISALDIPEAPSEVSATNVGTDAIGLTWRDNSSTEVGFRLEYSPDNVTFYPVANLGTNVTARTNSNLQCLTTYYHRIKAVGLDGDSAWAYAPPVSLFAPVPRIRYAGRTSDGWIVFGAEAPPQGGCAYSVETSTNLIHWELMISQLSCCPSSFSVNGNGQSGPRFYRVVARQR